MSHLIVYAGPSCVGKGPLREVLEHHHPNYRSIDEGGQVGRPVLYVSRDPRPQKGECEGHPYHFRTIQQIRDMVSAEPGRYISGWIRGDEQFQALDLREAKGLLHSCPLVLLEIYDSLAAQLLNEEHMDYLSSGSADINAISIFISPLSIAEIARLKDDGHNLHEVITRLMRRKLDRRATEKEDAKRQIRAQWAYTEMQHAHKYAHVIINRDGEDSDNWGLPHRKDDLWKLSYPIGDAKKTLETFIEILETGNSANTEHWKPDIL